MTSDDKEHKSLMKWSKERLVEEVIHCRKARQSEISRVTDLLESVRASVNKIIEVTMRY